MNTLWRDDLPRTLNPIRLFLFSSKPYLWSAVTALAAVLCAGILSSSVPVIFKLITNASAALLQGGSFDALWFPVGIYVFVTFFDELLWRVSGFSGSYWATGARLTARHALTSYVTLHSRAYFSDRFAGSVANKINHAASGMRELVEFTLWKVGEFVITICASLIIAFYTNVMIGSLFLTWIILVVILNAYFGKKRTPIAKRAQAIETELNGATVDLLSNVNAMQEYARRTFEIKRLQEISLRRRSVGMENWHYGERLLTMNGVFQTIFGMSMVYVAISLARVGVISIGDIVLVLTMIFRTRDQMMFIGSHIHHLSELWGEVTDSLEEIMTPHEIIDASTAQKLVVSDGALVFEAVTFQYAGGGDAVLNNFSLSLTPHEKIGVVGKSGTGKSTLVKLLLRHYDIDSGVIRIDGQNIAEVQQESLRDAVSLVPQEALLFHRTLRENIAYGKPDATGKDIEEAARMAFAHDFIMRLPKGYETMVGERGIKLSGGERQRIAIARAILKNSPILVLDEATASLDSESELAIQKALHSLMEGKTVIAIAHRLSTLREMDRIVVIDGGVIAEEGTHDSLIAEGGIYSELWKHQAGGFLQDE